MDKKDTTKPSATGDADGSLKTPLPEPSLGHQAFDVLKDVLVEEMVEENRKLELQNDQLDAVGKYLNSKVFIDYLGRKITLDLKDGKYQKGGHLIRIADVTAVPLLDLAQNSLVGSIFSGIVGAVASGSGQLSFPSSLAKETKVEVRLGRVFLGSLETNVSGIESAKFAKARNIDSHRSFLELSLSPLVRIGGHLTNVSDEDVCDGLKEFNEQVRARLIHGLPADIKNEDSITFTLKCIYLTINPGLIETALADFGGTVCEMPETILRIQLNGALETEAAYRELLDQNMALKSFNHKLVATRKWLSTIEFCYNGGSKTLSIEDGELMTAAGEIEIGFHLSNPDGKLPCASCSFNSLREVNVTLGGITISEGVSPVPDINFETETIAVRFDHVAVYGGLTIPENFQFPGNNIHQALFDSLQGQQNLPDEISFHFVGLVLRRSNRWIASTMEILGMSVPGNEIQEESADETSE